jgi:hypothetical protein
VKDASDTWSERHFHVSKLDAVTHALRGQEDTYISQASFASKRRGSWNAMSLRCVFVDIDQYKEGRSAKETEQIAEDIKEKARSLGVPEPSYIVNSGRGLYAKWVFDTPINASLMAGWKLLQRKLVSAYIPLGSDLKVVDPARVLRLQETINSKSGSEVRILSESKTLQFTDLLRSTADLDRTYAKPCRISYGEKSCSSVS